MRISPEEFVTVWQTSASCEKAAKKLGITPKVASAISSQLRQRGVPLKRFNFARDLKKLSLLARSLSKTNEEAEVDKE